MKNVLIIGAGGVAHVAAHKLAQNADQFGEVFLASRRIEKCEEIISSVARKNTGKSYNIKALQLDAMDVDSTVSMIERTKADIVMNLGTAFLNMHVLEACIRTGAAYIDTAIHEEPDRVATICEDPPWYGNYEWKRADRCRENGVTAILGVGFDPGVVNAYCAKAAKDDFDTIDTIDILDVNVGSHGKYFATNFDPEINFREFTGKVWAWVNGEWVCKKTHEEKREYDFPIVGRQPVYLTGHDELHSLYKNIPAKTIRFWMGFSEHYINCFNVLKNIGLLSEKSVRMPDGHDVVPLKLVKACLPNPMSLAPDYTGKTCIGCLVKGVRAGRTKELFIYNICDHEDCYREVESQAISYTAGVPPVAAAMLIAEGSWDVKKMANVEELDPYPFLAHLEKMGLPTDIQTTHNRVEKWEVLT